MPGLALAVRRLHDIGQPGWILLILIFVGLIPWVGQLIAFIGILLIGLMDGQPHENRFGVPVKRW
ncbi:DUF805 domain-containing protein [Rhodobacter maris]|uniref:Uncharacterized protein DUF805 n=1 Tax=Rhodobacter maris TaxID=446682 RepID=A0A285T3S1_9RHOB|nr:DUF805 domain-containing protein [Rhodobacter maris]SOC15961.1 uncharacterized protein DUF805 [Rhodobacter maris]